MLEIAAVRELVLGQAHPLPSGITALTSAALGLVLAQDIVADLDSPPFAKAMMDGYAVDAADLASGPVELTVIEEVPAGAMAQKTLTRGEAIAIMTGAPVPGGCTAVVMKEHCERLSESRVRVNDPQLMPGKNILLQAAEMRVGDVVLPRGTVITPVAFGLFATVGKTAVPTLPNPKVGVLVTGDELIEANMKPMGGQIRNSNGPMLVAEAVRVGALPRYLGIARDDAMIMKSMIREGLMTADILVLSGGVSAGKYDLVPEVLQDLGVTIHCQHVRMKPGKPLLFGTKGSTLVFGLPGNPVSAFVCFQQFVVPAIRKMAGHPDPGPEQFSLPLAQDFRTKNDRPTFHPARIERLTHGEVVHALPWQGSADLRALLRSNALLVLPAGEVKYQAGERVEVQRTGVSF